MKMKRILTAALFASLSVIGMSAQAAVVSDNHDESVVLTVEESELLFYSPNPDAYRTKQKSTKENQDMIEAFDKLRSVADNKEKHLAHLVEVEKKRKLDLAKKPDVEIGMTASQVLSNSSWGEPEYKKTNANAERWVYSNGKYLFMKNGRVTAVEN